MHIRSVDEITKVFNTDMATLITKLEKKSRRADELANLDRLRKRISLLRSLMGSSATLHEAAPFFIYYSGQILEPEQAERDRFFMELDVRGEYMRHVEHTKVNAQDEFLFDLVSTIRSHYRAATQLEKDEVYAAVKSMLECCIEYDIQRPRATPAQIFPT